MRILICILLTTAGIYFQVDKASAQMAIFDGQSLQGWTGDTSLWSVEDGALTGRTTADQPIKDNSFLIWNGKLKDFELRLRFRIVGGNSGIQFRSQDLGSHRVSGYQADIDAGMRFMGILYDEHGRGILSERGLKVVWGPDGPTSTERLALNDEQFRSTTQPGEWNEYVIRAEGNHIVQTINGQTVVDFTDDDPAQADAEGVLALQIHTGPPMTVQFKDLQLVRLGAEALGANSTPSPSGSEPAACCSSFGPTRRIARCPKSCCGRPRRGLFCR